ncbi:MAG: hypothetical protein FWC44_02265 [Methanomassiliicoccaceae archaeon]|nr:hypothetical protein [Methanomassiliicoccaceae archaeon]
MTIDIRSKKSVLALLTIATALAMVLAAVPAATGAAAGGGVEIKNKGIFGGGDYDWYSGMAATSDGGFVAVGGSSTDSFNNGSWGDVIGYGNDDAIIVKYNSAGIVEWQRHFGGVGNDEFNAVVEVSDGYVAVGSSGIDSFFNNDWSDVSSYGNDDAIIVKYDFEGTMQWRHHFGGAGNDKFFALAATPGGVVAVGYSYEDSFGNSDWPFSTGYGVDDAIIVTYDLEGNRQWYDYFGGAGNDNLYSVTATSEGIVAVGLSNESSFGTGCLIGSTGYGGDDAIVLRYSFGGEFIGWNYFGGAGNDEFYAVTAASDGFVAVGYANEDSFGDDDLVDFSGYGSDDAIIVKYDLSGNLEWCNAMGGVDYEGFIAVAATSDGFVAVGWASSESFDTGDWEGVLAYGEEEAIIAKFDLSGNLEWCTAFGGEGDDCFSGVAVTSKGFVAVGWSYSTSFGTGGWEGLEGYGAYDAIFVEFNNIGGSSKYQYYIKASSDSNSKISPSGTTVVQRGDELKFTFTASSGYHISSVVIDGLRSLTQEEIDLGYYTFTDVMANHSISVKSAVGSGNGGGGGGGGGGGDGDGDADDAGSSGDGFPLLTLIIVIIGIFLILLLIYLIVKRGKVA